MRAIQFSAFGGVEQLKLLDIPQPKPGPGFVLVKVKCASINPVDWKRASGSTRLILPVTFPSVPGYDLSGEIAELGPGVSGFSVGERVHARALTSGASADFALAEVSTVTRMPDSMSFADASAIPLAGMTALQGLRNESGMPLSGATQRVLVVGASGGVGHFGVQMAKAAGATVVGVCSGRNVELVRSLGITEVVDYTQPDPYKNQAPFDIVLDCVSDNPAAFLPLVKAGGTYACALPGPQTIARFAVNFLRSKKCKPIMLKSNAADLAILDQLYADGKLKVVIDSRYPLEKLADAWTRSMSGRATGKIVVDVA